MDLIRQAVSFYSSYSTPPEVATAWGSDTAPLNQSRQRTRDQLRVILLLPVSLDALVEITVAMNTIADLSPEAVSRIEELLAEHKGLKAQQIAAQSKAAWDGAAPLKRADVLEYDTSLLAAGDWASVQTRGLVDRQRSIEAEIRTALGAVGQRLSSGSQTSRLYRS